MPDTANHAALTRWRNRLEMAGSLIRGRSPQMSQAIEACLTAMAYDDPALIRSHLNEVLEALRDFVNEEIRNYLPLPQHAREIWRDVSEDVKNVAAESCDELGRELESHFDEQQRTRTSFLNGPVRLLQNRGYVVESAPRLASAIEELKRFQEGVFANWPWSNHETPPVNRTMVAESRAAMRRGEGERLEDLIQRLGGVPPRAS